MAPVVPRPAEPFARRGTTGFEAPIFLTESEALLSRQASLVERLTPADQAVVRAHGRMMRLKAGDLLFRQGAIHDGIVVIETGQIRSFYTAPSGREITLAYWSPGHFVGGPEVFGGGLHMWSAEAARPSTLIFLPGEGLRELARRVPDLALGLIDALVFKARCYTAFAQMLGTRSVAQRLVQLLQHLANVYGVPDARGILVAAAFTHADLAALIGATRQWVTVQLGRMQADGILTHHRGLMVILKPEALVAPREGAGGE
ncbi:Crp/Fnr family transcriptional regulator [Aquabacter spiritensis]|uniref:CRP-like cAMP-binding protein n=1 Tax=Aquabacter spiritensis TaxID=933073 RepID=A0A4R3LWM1_9HYPH|nr:Crp/Fnr family transcriptional regulator [Aquabacter spiritensis]TCT05014.1 CRP-like cAMP-binding protein [Aquabacter spiritensis]